MISKHLNRTLLGTITASLSLLIISIIISLGNLSYYMILLMVIMICIIYVTGYIITEVIK